MSQNSQENTCARVSSLSTGRYNVMKESCNVFIKSRESTFVFTYDPVRITLTAQTIKVLKPVT